MSTEAGKKKRRNAEFWRAVGFLRPHWRIVAVSITCAFVVGVAFTSGLSTMLPIMQVLIRGDSVQGWVDRQVVAHRLGITLADDPDHVTVVKVTPGKLGATAGLDGGERIVGVQGLTLPVAAKGEKQEKIDRRKSAAILRVLASESTSAADVTIQGQPQPVPLSFGRVPLHL